MNQASNIPLVNAIIWAAAIVASAVELRGTQYAGIMLIILGGAAAASIILVAR